MKNTLSNGQIRSIIFKEGSTWYAIAMELNIVESGNDPREVMILLDEAIRGYLKSARKSKLSDTLLNQVTEPEYEKLWDQIQTNKQPINSPLKVYSSASLMLPSFA